MALVVKIFFRSNCGPYIDPSWSVVAPVDMSPGTAMATAERNGERRLRSWSEGREADGEEGFSLGSQVYEKTQKADQHRFRASCINTPPTYIIWLCLLNTLIQCTVTIPLAPGTGILDQLNPILDLFTLLVTLVMPTKSRCWRTLIMVKELILRVFQTTGTFLPV